MTEETKTPEPDPKRGLAAKIAEVQLEIAERAEAFPKRTVTVRMKAKQEGQEPGTYTYSYIEESTLMSAIRGPLASRGVAVFYSDRILSIAGNLASVEAELRLVDGATGDREVMTSQGVGTDQGDKAVNKAKTAAMRYLLWKWFLVPSDVDPEEENIKRENKPPREQIQWATEEQIEEYLAEVAAAGFAIDPARAVIEKERAEWEGVRADFLAEQRKQLQAAAKKAGATA